MTPTLDMFPEKKLPRRSPRVMMQYRDGGVGNEGEIVQYECPKCSTRSGWEDAGSITEVKRGIPCPECNKD